MLPVGRHDAVDAEGDFEGAGGDVPVVLDDHADALLGAARQIVDLDLVEGLRSGSGAGRIS